MVKKRGSKMRVDDVAGNICQAPPDARASSHARIAPRVSDGVVVGNDCRCMMLEAVPSDRAASHEHSFLCQLNLSRFIDANAND